MADQPIQPDSPPDPESLDQQLVAYLDGELDEKTARELETQLAANASMREELNRLEQTWDMLETLDQADVEETFVQTTMEMVAVQAEDELQRQREQAPVARRRRWLAIGTAAALAVAIGFFVTRSAVESPNQQLLEDLPVLENYDKYRQVQEVEFLRTLLEREAQGELLLPEVEGEEDHAG